jgi:hypothetical protein
VQQAVDAAEVQEGAVVGEVLDHAVELQAFLQLLEQLLALGAVLLLDDGAAGDDDVVAPAVQLDDLELEVLAFEVGGVAHRAHVDQRAGQEGADAAELDGEAALDLAVDHALDGLAVLEGLLQLSQAAKRFAFSRDSRVVPKPSSTASSATSTSSPTATSSSPSGADELVAGDDALGLQAGVDDDGRRA